MGLQSNGGATAPANPPGDFGVRQIVGTAHLPGAGAPNPVIIDQRSNVWDEMYNKT